MNGWEGGRKEAGVKSQSWIENVGGAHGMQKLGCKHWSERWPWKIERLRGDVQSRVAAIASYS